MNDIHEDINFLKIVINQSVVSGTSQNHWLHLEDRELAVKAHRTLGVQASVFEQCVSGDTRVICSAQCAGFVPLGSSFLSLLLRVRNTRRVE